MGITGLWEIIGEGEICSISDFAARHFQQHKRPLRIAVDEACWRFTNLTPEQVVKIREGEPSANPVEKVIFWRVLRLLRLNVQLLFVNDGPRRPWKRNKRGGNKVDYELARLTHQLLDHLGVPHHEAPGEAEAECAKLQAAGIVDAVWSDDGDALMFGCDTLIRQHKEKGSIVKDQIRVYRACDIQNKFDLDADSLVLFALLSGGDYSTEGLRGCGPKTAALLAKTAVGLASAVCHAPQHALPAWRALLQEHLLQAGKSINVPWTFPDFKSLGYYRNPTVSNPEQLHSLRGLRNGWDRPINQAKLRVLLRERFHVWTRGYLKHITPIFLVRSLARASDETRSANSAFDIQFKRTRVKKDDKGEVCPKSEAKITFSPLPVLDVDIRGQPPEEDWSIFANNDGTPYDPIQPVETEILRCLLEHGMAPADMEAATVAVTNAAVKRKKTIPIIESIEGAERKNVGSQTSASAAEDKHSNTAAKKRGRQRTDTITASAGGAHASVKKPKAALETSSAVREESPFKPRAVFQLPSAMLDYESSCHSEVEHNDSDSEVEVLFSSTNAPALRCSPPAAGLAKKLPEMKAGATSLVMSRGCEQRTAQPISTVFARSSQSEVIDLT